MPTELIIPEQHLPAVDAGSSLVQWLIAYCLAEVAGSPKMTLDAKTRDFLLFLGYFAQTMRSNSIDDWTRSVMLGSVQWTENEANKGRRYATPSFGHAGFCFSTMVFARHSLTKEHTRNFRAEPGLVDSGLRSKRAP